MDTSIFKIQIDQLRVRLLNDIEKKVIEIGQPDIFFNKQFYYVEPFNPEILISIYGFSGNKLMYDSLKVITKEININTLPCEILLLINQELEYIRISNLMMPKED